MNFLDYVTLFFLQYIPNGLIYVLAGYAISKKTVDVNKYLISSGILAVFGFGAKILSQTMLLNTSNTVPQILILFACIILLVSINNIKIVNGILSSLSIMILQLIFEGVYVMLILRAVLKINIETIFQKSLLISSLIGLPYLILLGFIVYIFYKLMIKKGSNYENP